MLQIKGIEQMLTCAKSGIEHTCLHKKDYNIDNAGDLGHAREEINHVIQHLKHIQMSLCGCVYDEHHVSIWDYFDKLLVVLTKLRKELNDPAHDNLTSYRAHIDHARGEVHKIIDEMVDKFLEDSNIAKEFYRLSK